MTVLHQTPAKMMQHIRETFPDASYVRVEPSMRILVRFDKYVRPATVRKALPLYTIFPADFDAFGVKPPTGSACWGSIPRIGRPPGGGGPGGGGPGVGGPGVGGPGVGGPGVGGPGVGGVGPSQTAV
jgi:hypothetical protein